MNDPLPAPDRLEHLEALVLAEDYSAAPPEVVREAGLGHEWVDGTVAGWASNLDILMFNRALCAGQRRPATRAALAAVAERFDRAGVPRSFLQLAPGTTPADLSGWLGPLGYAPHNRWAKLARGLSDLPPIPGHVRVERIGPERAREYAGIVVEAFGVPPILGPWRQAMVGRPRWGHYLASLDGKAVGCAASFVDDGLAWFGQAGTLPAARGRGVQGALIARRLADAAAAGCTHVVVETAEDTAERPAPSFRNQLRFGFTLCYLRVNYLRARPAAP